MLAAFAVAAVLGFAVPSRSQAAIVLALPHSEYPRGTRVAVLPATNVNADRYLRPVHRTPFMRLRRIDAAGWLQFGSWKFQTRAGGATTDHAVTFGYGINLFRRPDAAHRALADVKLKTAPSRIAHVPSRRYRAVTAQGTLVFIFFAYRTVEVEAYYEYAGVAPAAMAKRLRHVLLRQEAHLVALAKRLSRVRRPAATLVPTGSPTATPSPTAVRATPIDTPTVPPSPTATPAPTVPPSATPTATALSVQLAVTAAPARPAYAPGEVAVIEILVTADGRPLAGAAVNAVVMFYQQSTSCSTVTGPGGTASCAVTVPATTPEGTARVTVNASWTRGAPASTSTTFEVKAST